MVPEAAYQIIMLELVADDCRILWFVPDGAGCSASFEISPSNLAVEEEPHTQTGLLAECQDVWEKQGEGSNEEGGSMMKEGGGDPSTSTHAQKELHLHAPPTTRGKITRHNEEQWMQHLVALFMAVDLSSRELLKSPWRREESFIWPYQEVKVHYCS